MPPGPDGIIGAAAGALGAAVGCIDGPLGAGVFGAGAFGVGACVKPCSGVGDCVSARSLAAFRSCV